MKAASLRKFSKSYSGNPSSSSSSSQDKKILNNEASPSYFIALFLFSIMRRPVFISIVNKIGFYLCLAAGGSLITDIVKMPPSYFSNKHNSLNIVFAKWGWGWTCVPLSFFIIMSSYTYTAGNVKQIRGHLMRVLFGSLCWYVCTNTFRSIEDATGQCFSMSNNATIVSETKKRFTSRRLCHKNGGNWVGFDISGHCFLMVLNNLWIIEELRIMQFWTRLHDIVVNNKRQDMARGVTDREHSVMKRSYDANTNVIRILFVILACLLILWDVIFIATILYYHNMPTKLLGTVTATLCWFICYKVIFPMSRAGSVLGLSPGLPGDGLINFVIKN